MDTSDQSVVMVNSVFQDIEGSGDFSNLGSNDMELMDNRSDAFSEPWNLSWSWRSDDEAGWSSSKSADVDSLLSDNPSDLGDLVSDVSDVDSQGVDLSLDWWSFRFWGLLNLDNQDMDLVSDVSDLLGQFDDLVDMFGDDCSSLFDLNSDLLWMDTRQGWSH